MKLQAMIFDLDGVLVSTDEYHYEAWKKMADRIGVPFDRKVNERLRGVSRMESLEIILEKSGNKRFSQEEKVQLAEEKNGYYREMLGKMTPDDVDSKVRKVLNELRKRGYRLAVGSSSKNAGMILERTGLYEYFDAVADGTHITKSKPDPEVFLKAAEFLHVAPEYCLVVEDADAGIEAGKRAGMETAAVGSAAKHGAGDHCLQNFEELLNIVE